MAATKEIKGFDNIFSERLRNLMEDTRTTQSMLADYIGTSRQTISKYIDETAIPNIDKLSKICKYFDVSSDYLLGHTDILNTIDPCYEANRTIKRIAIGDYPNCIVKEPSLFDIGAINYLLSDLDITLKFFNRLSTYFEERLQDEELMTRKQIHDKPYKEDDETDYANYLLKRLTNKIIDDCYHNFFKTYKKRKTARIKSGRKRIESNNAEE